MGKGLKRRKQRERDEARRALDICKFVCVSIYYNIIRLYLFSQDRRGNPTILDY